MLFPVLWGLWLSHKVRSELRTARQMAENLSELARRLNDPDLSLQAHQALGMTAFCRGELETSLAHVEQGVALYDPQRHVAHAFQFGQDPAVICKGFGAVVLWLLGFPDAAARQSDEAIEMAKELSPSSQAVATFFAAMVYRLRGDLERSRLLAKACGAAAAEHRLSFWMAGSTLLAGGAATDRTDGDEGAAIRRGLVEWQATGSVTYRTFFLGLLAEALLDRGAEAEALSTLDEALALVETTDERFYVAELHRLRGEALLRAANDREKHDEAERHFREALATAQEQNARSLALRAAMSLAELAAADDDGADEGRAILADSYNRLTEGFFTPDLQRASAMLRQPR
jgi:adenylate cyclase